MQLQVREFNQGAFSRNSEQADAQKLPIPRPRRNLFVIHTFCTNITIIRSSMRLGPGPWLVSTISPNVRTPYLRSIGPRIHSGQSHCKFRISPFSCNAHFNTHFNVKVANASNVLVDKLIFISYTGAVPDCHINMTQIR